MKIPSLFYGKAGQATSRVRKLAKSLLQTREFGGYDPGPFLDTKEVSGLVLIHELRLPAYEWLSPGYCRDTPIEDLQERYPDAEDAGEDE